MIRRFIVAEKINSASIFIVAENDFHKLLMHLSSLKPFDRKKSEK
jgi:hypothetical protein